FYEKKETLLDYLNKNYCIFLDERRKIEQRAKNILIDNENLIKALLDKKKIIPEALENLKSFEEIEELLNKRQIIYLEKEDNKENSNIEKYIFDYHPINYY